MADKNIPKLQGSRGAILGSVLAAGGLFWFFRRPILRFLSGGTYDSFEKSLNPSPPAKPTSWEI